MRGLRFNELSYAPDHDVRGSFVVGLSSSLGRPALGNYHEPNGRGAYRHIKARPIAHDEPITLINSTRDGFPHTDSAFKPLPEPVFCLFMVRPAMDGGDSLIWSARALMDWIGAQALGNEVLEMLRVKKFPFIGVVLSKENVYRDTILMDGQLDRIRYKRDAIEDAAKALGRDLSAEEKLVMDTLDAAAAVPDLISRFSLGIGDAVILDNHRALHSRTPYWDRERHILKTTIHPSQIV